MERVLKKHVEKEKHRRESAEIKRTAMTAAGLPFSGEANLK